MKRFLACFLICVLLVGSLASCLSGTETESETESTTEPTDNTQTTVDVDPEAYKDSYSWSIETLPESSEGLKFKLNNSGDGYLVAGIGTCENTVIVIGKHEGLPVKGIEKLAFAGCSKLENVIIANCVRDIGNSAFANCVGLTKLVLPVSVMTIGDKAFYNCTQLKEINLPKHLVNI